MTSSPEIIGSPSRITADYLSRVLQYSGCEATVSEFSASNVGTGQVGQNVRFKLTYAPGAANDAPASVVGKFTSDDPVSRQTGIALENYLKEVRFYQELRTSLAIQTPQVLFTDINPETHDFVLLMEDLAPAEQGDQLEGCDISRAELGLKELARLHGPRWADEGLFTYQWLGRSDPEADATVNNLYSQLLPGFLERYGSLLSDAQKTMGQALGECFHNYVALNRDQARPMTVIHGDYRLDNMMFGGAYPVAVVDWQSPAIGNAGQDLSYWVGTSLNSDLRRAHDDQLVDCYYQHLSAYDIGDYSREQCWTDYRLFAVAGWNMAVIASMIVGQTDRGDEMFMAMARRSAQMAIDLDTLELLA